LVFPLTHIIYLPRYLKGKPLEIYYDKYNHKKIIKVKHKPVVTVVIPVYNSAGTIWETLDSIAAQTYQNWEVVCVDDGSTDNSIEIINEYISKQENLNIRLIRRKTQNKGGSVCRNIGARAAEGSYLIFLDADDLLGKTCLENRVRAIEDQENLFVVFPMAAFVNDDLTTAHVYSRLHVKEPLYMFLSGFGTWQVTSPIIRKDFFEQLGGFDESYPRLQDVEFHIRALMDSHDRYEIKRHSEADCFYRQGGSTELVVEKLKLTVVGCRKLISLIEGYAVAGVFHDRKKLSLSLSSLYCHLSMYQDMIKINDSSYVRNNPVMDSGLQLYITKPTRRFICKLEHIKNIKLRLFACRVTDKYLRALLAK